MEEKWIKTRIYDRPNLEQLKNMVKTTHHWQNWYKTESREIKR